MKQVHLSNGNSLKITEGFYTVDKHRFQVKSQEFILDSNSLETAITTEELKELRSALDTIIKEVEND